jgi:Domain of unknown function DUF29
LIRRKTFAGIALAFTNGFNGCAAHAIARDGCHDFALRIRLLRLGQRASLLAALRAGKLSSADIENIAAEIESMSKSEKRELVSRLTILLLQLLKWQFQPGLRGNGWRSTIKLQRRDVPRHLADSPSLSAQLPAVLGDSYTSALLLAAGETGLPEALFPAACN